MAKRIMLPTPLPSPQASASLPDASLVDASELLGPQPPFLA